MTKIATKTLAEIYLRQGHLKEAYEIYKILHQKDPDDIEVLKKLEEIEERLITSSKIITPLQNKREEILKVLEKWLENIKKRK